MTQRVSLHYAAVPSQLLESLHEEWMPCLPAAKAAAIGRLHRAADRNASLLGIVLLAAACAELGWEFDPATLEYSDKAKPRLPRGPDFNISHTRGLVACAVAESGRVGLDIEPCGSVTASTAARILSIEERGAIGRGALSATDAWVMKEAVVKLGGRGIGALRAVALDATRATLGGEGYWLEAVALQEGYIAWLASDRAARRVAVHALDALAAAPLPRRR